MTNTKPPSAEENTAFIEALAKAIGKEISSQLRLERISEGDKMRAYFILPGKALDFTAAAIAAGPIVDAFAERRAAEARRSAIEECVNISDKMAENAETGNAIFGTRHRIVSRKIRRLADKL